MIIDLHCDTIWRIDCARENNQKLSLKKSNLQIDEEGLIKGGYLAQCFAIYIPNKFENPYEKCLDTINLYYSEINSCDNIAPLYQFSDFEKNKKAGKISSILTMEDGCPIGEDISRLYNLYDLGVRMICLTHNLVNPIGHPNFGRYLPNGLPDITEPNVNEGLTEFGKFLVKKMNELGVIVDVSHLSDKGFYEVIELSEKPIVASHSNARGLCNIVRNLTDDMLYKLADNGGVMGMNFADEFLHKETGKNTVEHVINHINYIKSKIGVDNIAIGSDLDGIDPNIELRYAWQMDSLIKGFEKAGFTANEIDKITYKNALRVFKECIE